MKNVLFGVIICLFYAANSRAAIITAIANGSWTSASTWDANRTPQDNDQVIIPFSTVVLFSGSPYPKNSPTARPTLNIKIYGTLDFSAVGNDKLYLDAGSTIEIFSTGKIQTNTSSSEIIAIYTGTTDNTVWTGTPATLSGPANATSTTSGFANGILPVKLESFSIRKDHKGFATLTWTTSAEINFSHFEIERSSFQSANWQFAGSVDPSGNLSSIHQYHFTTPLFAGENLFRLKQVDIDGNFTYSIVLSIRYNDNNTVNINYNNSTHQLSVKGLQDEQVNIHIFNATGHTMFTGSASAPIVFEPAPGVYFVNVVNRGACFARKIMVY